MVMIVVVVVIKYADRYKSHESRYERGRSAACQRGYFGNFHRAMSTNLLERS